MEPADRPRGGGQNKVDGDDDEDTCSDEATEEPAGSSLDECYDPEVCAKFGDKYLNRSIRNLVLPTFHFSLSF